MTSKEKILVIRLGASHQRIVTSLSVSERQRHGLGRDHRGRLQEEQLASDARARLIGAQERRYRALSQPFDRRGELILGPLLKGNPPVDHLAAATVGDLAGLAIAEDVLQDADDHVVVDVGGGRGARRTRRRG